VNVWSKDVYLKTQLVIDVSFPSLALPYPAACYASYNYTLQCEHVHVVFDVSHDRNGTTHVSILRDSARRVTILDRQSGLPRMIKQRRRTWTCSRFERDEAERMSLTGGVISRCVRLSTSRTINQGLPRGRRPAAGRGSGNEGFPGSLSSLHEVATQAATMRGSSGFFVMRYGTQM
jgi:hypothetical protein